MAIPIGHTGTTLTTTQRHLAQALSTARPEIERSRARREVHYLETAARIYDSSLFETLMQALAKLAQPRLICIIHHLQNLVHAQVREVRRTRVNSDATPA